MRILVVPATVAEYCERYRSMFGNARQFEHFQRYVTGLILSENVTVEGINALFPAGTDPSCLNRFLTEAPWDENQFNTRRLRLLQEDPQTRWSREGVVVIDNTFNRHDGKHFDLIAKLKDHTHGDYAQIHDLVTSHYADFKVQYPIEYRLFIPEKVAEREQKPFRTHTALAVQLVHDTERRQCPAQTYAFDTAYTVQELTSVIEGYGKGWVGSIKTNRWIFVSGLKVKVGEFAKSLPASAYRKIDVDGTPYWVFTKSVRVSHFDHKLRIVISYDNREREGDPKILVTNRLSWEPIRILRQYQKRWAVETFYHDSKQELGLDGYEMRAEDGFRRHWYLVFASYSLLVQQLHACGLCHWFSAKLITLGEARRHLTRDVLRHLVEWVHHRAQQGGSLQVTFRELALEA